MASKKGSNKKQTVEDIDQFLSATTKTQQFTADQMAGYFLVAFIMTLVPAYLYHSVFDMTVADNGLIYLGLTIASAVMLTMAYRNVEQSTQKMLSGVRKSGKYSGAKSAEDTASLLYQESLAWSFFLNNALFVCLFLFNAFYVLRSIDTVWNYVLSMSISAAATLQLSNSR